LIFNPGTDSLFLRPIRSSNNYIAPYFLIILLLFSSIIFCLPQAQADDSKIPENSQRPQWFLTAFGGIHSQDRLRDLFRGQATFPDDTNIAAIALGKEVWHYENWVGLEAEAQTAKHFGTMDHWEFNALLILRWHPFIWDKYIETSLAVGDGISYATEIPAIEKEKGSGHAMNYLLYELTLGLPEMPKWAFVIRYHHRSSIFGLINNYKGSSNFLCAGIKYYF
jgi:hypothetical protein